MKYALIVLLFLTSCSTTFHCKRCFDKAPIQRDTIIRDTTIYLPVALMDTVFTPGPESLDTLILEGPERIKIKYLDLPGPTVYIGVECPPDSVVVEKKIYIENTAKVGYNLWQVIAACLLTVGFVTVVFLIKR